MVDACQSALVRLDDQSVPVELSFDRSRISDPDWFKIREDRGRAIGMGAIPLRYALDRWPPRTLSGYPNVLPLGYCFDEPFWRSIMSLLDPFMLPQFDIAIWDWRPNYHDLRRSFPRHRLSDISNHERPRLLIIDGKSECMNPVEHMNDLLRDLHANGLTSDEILYVSGNSVSSTMCRCLQTRYMLNSDYYEFSTEPSQLTMSHYVMLIRRPKTLRISAVVEILHRGLRDHGSISCGVLQYDDAAWIAGMVPAEYQQLFPMCVDSASIDDDQQYLCEHPGIRNAAINVVCETSQDRHLTDHWFDVFLTEKTAKPFLLCQIPIWIAVPGSVADVRSLGFDVFDDIIDHGYDSMADPSARISAAIDQLQRLCDIPIDDLADLRLRLWPRLLSNLDLIRCMGQRVRPNLVSGIENHMRAILASH